MLENIRELLKKDGICIIDISNKFKEFKECDYTNICEGECPELKKYVIENEKIEVLKTGVKLYKRFTDKSQITFFETIENWEIINGSELEKSLINSQLKVIDIKRGYDNTTSHRDIYIIGREV